MGLTGKVYLVGAGPGDAGLLTMRGAELLRRADVGVYDALVNRELLALAPEAAEVIFGGKLPRDRAIPQDELNRLLAEKAGAGKTVVRLKGGDPYIFGRGGEEAAGLHRDGVPFEVVPGISSIIAAPSYAGIPLTHREHCSSFTVITGHEDPDKEESALDWERIASEPGTKVFLMGVERIGKIAAALEANGLDARSGRAIDGEFAYTVMLRAGPIADLAKRHRHDTARHQAGIDPWEHAQIEPAIIELRVREQHVRPAKKTAVADTHPLSQGRAAVPRGGQSRRLGLKRGKGGKQVGQRPDFFLQRNADTTNRVAVQPGTGHLDETTLGLAILCLQLGLG